EVTHRTAPVFGSVRWLSYYPVAYRKVTEFQAVDFVTKRTAEGARRGLWSGAQPDVLAAQFGHRGHAQELHRPLGLDGEDVGRPLHSPLAAGHEAVEEGPADQDGPGAEGHGGDDVGAVADAAVEVDLGR